MQFIAEDPVHVVIRNESLPLMDPSGRGVIRDGQRHVYAKFARGTAPAWARALGLATFEFKKRPEGVMPEQWLAFYDTVEDQQKMGWTDEERETIEAKLRTVDGVIEVAKPLLAPPWPAYDKIVAEKAPGLSRKQIAEKIAAKVVEDGYEPAEVAAYELENKARKDVLAALAKLAGAAFAAGETEEDEELVEA